MGIDQGNQEIRPQSSCITLQLQIDPSIIHFKITEQLLSQVQAYMFELQNKLGTIGYTRSQMFVGNRAYGNILIYEP